MTRKMSVWLRDHFSLWCTSKRWRMSEVGDTLWTWYFNPKKCRSFIWISILDKWQTNLTSNHLETVCNTIQTVEPGLLLDSSICFMGINTPPPDMAVKHWNCNRKQHVVRIHPPVTKPILQGNYHGFLQYARRISPAAETVKCLQMNFAFY